MRRTTPAEPIEPIEPAEPLFKTIKGQYAPRANPEHDNCYLFHVKHDALPFNNNNHIFKGENDHGKRNA